VAPPGASHHLALLAFDVKEHGQPAVRRILERHGWYQTVVRDAPHFTYLGMPKSRLESLGLTVVRDGDREYWKPRPASTSPVEAGSLPAKEIFGYSVEGRPLWAYIFGRGPNVTMIFGAFHNNEPASFAVVEALRRYLAARPQEWRGRTIIVVPQTNPDAEWSRVRWNSNGVDLNRNFPVYWSVMPVEARYSPGAAPASEPETQAVMRLVEKYAPSKIVSIHQPFRCLNWDGETGHLLAEEMGTQNGYPVVADIGYPTPGSFGSYCASKGIAMVTLEMPDTDFAACWRQNKQALLAAVRLEMRRKEI
jgi:protein MpaA